MAIIKRMAEQPPAAQTPLTPRFRRGGLVGWATALLPAGNPAGAVYGLIVIGALLAAESGRHEKYIDTVGSALVVATLYWLGHAYSTAVADRLVSHEPLSAATLRRALAHDFALMRGAGLPMVVLALCWVVGADQEAAVTAALWTTIAGLVVFELLAGLHSSSSVGELVFGVSVGLTIGVGILALRIILD